MSDLVQIESAKPEVRGKNDLAVLRSKLAAATGPTYWKSLEQIAETEDFQDLLKHEFPKQADVWADGLDRRKFLGLMGASFALGGLTNCTIQPREAILPYAKSPESEIPGIPRFFATMTSLGGYAEGVLAESHQGRPTHVEGNPSHPASLGAASAFSTASVLDLYDPDRSQVVRRNGRISGWGAFLAELQRSIAEHDANDGADLRILTRTIGSPSEAGLIRQVLEKYPQARWHQWEPVNRDNAFAGAEAVFGERFGVHYRFDQAKVILSLDADFLSAGPGALRYTREFARGRRVPSEDAQNAEMNRLYVVESVMTPTGAAADHRLRLKSSQMASFAAALAAQLGAADEGEFPAHAEWLDAVVEDLSEHRGQSIVIAGDSQPAYVHAAAHAINAALGNLGETVLVTENPLAEPVDQAASISDLVQAMNAGEVRTLLIFGGNPVFDAPADLNFGTALEKVEMRAHLALHVDETSELCHWHLPIAHPLEAWGDGRAFDGTVSLQQPLIQPLYEGKSESELLAALLGLPDRPGLDLLRGYWSAEWQLEGEQFETKWQRSLHDGFVEDSALSPVVVSIREDWAAAASRPQPVSESGLEILFRPDPTLWDGRWANNGWMQEAAKPITLTCWDNAAFLSPATAEASGLSNGDVITLKHSERRVDAPAWIVPGQADDTVLVHFGYGRRRTGRVGSGTGFDAFGLRAVGGLWASNVELEPRGREYAIACVQDHASMEDRHLVRHATLDGFQENPAFPKDFDHSKEGLTAFPGYEYDGNAWGMAIDLNACIGCNACSVACQSENNIPIVGKEQVLMGREMAWIRIDRYFEGSLDEPEVHHQPVACMHCENAPCEVVCPVGATVHSSEGLNEMVYNRCIGTRYCSNNCPYKVRRFNFLLYSDFETETYKMMRNPDVSVRSRGVMEKCTYCVQRINSARIDAEKEHREIRDGEIRTACESACPAEAIVFGNINDPESRVAKLKADSRNYGLLTELNTAPRTSYLARVRNPNPRLAPADEGAETRGH